MGVTIDAEGFADCARQAREWIAERGTQALVDELRQARADKRRVKLGTANVLVLLEHVDRLEAIAAVSDLRVVVDVLLDYKAREGAGIWKLDTPKADAALAELELFAAQHHRVLRALLDATGRAERLEAAIRAQWSPEQAEAIIATAQGETADDGKIESFDHAAGSGSDKEPEQATTSGDDRSAFVSGTALISAERARQVTAEGWTPEHDDKHSRGSLARAAACYAQPKREMIEEWDDDEDRAAMIPADWPWEPRFWRPTPDDRVRELVKAGALIAAEIDRLLRAAGGVLVAGSDPQQTEAGDGASAVDSTDATLQRLAAIADAFEDVDDTVRILKVAEECGEAAEAWIGWLGANARKGRTHDEWNVANELADVVITAFVALRTVVVDPWRAIIDRTRYVHDRLVTAGIAEPAGGVLVAGSDPQQADTGDGEVYGEDANVVGSALHVACYGPGLSLRKYETAKAALRRLSNLVCVSEQAQMILRRDQIIREREADLTDANRRGHELDVENEELERALRAARAWVEKDRAGAEEWGTLEQVDAAEELLILIDAALGERDPT